MVDVVKLDSAGLRGAGAYEYWLAEGNVGTVQDFLDSQEAAAAAQVDLAEAQVALANAAANTATAAADSLTDALSTIDVLDQTTFAANIRENDTALLAQTALYPITPSDNVTCWGDSLTDGAAAGSPDKWTEVLADFITGVTVNEQGTGGETAAQILVRIQAAAANVKDDISTVWMGTNSFGSVTAEAIVADYASAATALGHTNYIMIAPHHTTYRGDALRVESLLRSTYGAKAYRPYSILPKIMQGSETGLLAMRRHTLPADVSGDGLHPNKNWTLGIGQEMGRMTRAISGGAPYVHDDIVGIKSGDAADTAVLTTRILGTPLGYSIVSGNPDDVVRISPTTGALTRGAGALTDSIREVYVEARNRKGAHRGRIALVRQLDGTSPQTAVRILGNGASQLFTPGLTGFANGKAYSVVLCARLGDANVNGGHLFNGLGAIRQDADGLRMRAIIVNTVGGAMGNAYFPTAADPQGVFNFYFFSIDAAALTMKLATNGSSSSTAVTDETMPLASIRGLFTNSGDSIPITNMDIKMLWMAPNYIDFTSATERDRFYNPSTLAPLDLGADGTVNSISPVLYLRGRAGDYLAGPINHGTGGDLYAPNYIDRANIGFIDVE